MSFLENWSKYYLDKKNALTGKAEEGKRNSTVLE
jgi:hypothetical protein